MAKRFSFIERQQHLDAWQRSGLTKQECCRQHSITISGFNYWIKLQLLMRILTARKGLGNVRLRHFRFSELRKR
ncbi:hypothetical protein EDF78_10741 [Rahnella sp. BIGb0236]|uniref:IS66 family insertion sequence element accessory protein TnpA n=1 Tax=Yersiniaceae TaxID=1903411 RepID=UPI000F4DCA3F|nr:MULTISPECIES: hypothetical protein [Yersiniaceae]MBX9478814.1 hypothetical protein [Yersinia enterocolitica]TDS90194.1 hypothetical protein EDF78_10741 [Rahnella sp. BIGb0236]